VNIDNFGAKITKLFRPDLHALFTAEDDTGEDCLFFVTGHKLGSNTIRLSHGFSPSQSAITGPSQVTYHAAVFLLMPLLYLSSVFPNLQVDAFTFS